MEILKISWCCLCAAFESHLPSASALKYHENRATFLNTYGKFVVRQMAQSDATAAN